MEDQQEASEEQTLLGAVVARDAEEVDYSPLEYAPVTYADYLLNGGTPIEEEEVDYSPLEYAPVMNENHLLNGGTPVVEEDPQERVEPVVEPVAEPEPVLGDGSLTHSSGDYLSDWSETYLSCIMCPTKLATHGDLCRECWLIDKQVDKIFAAQWRRLHFLRPGKHEEDPIVISSDDGEE